MMRRALAAWLALTAAEVLVPTPTGTFLSNSTTTTTTIDPWSPLLGDTEGAPTVTEPSAARRRGEESLVESIRSQLMHDNYDYAGKGSAELTQNPQSTPVTNADRVIQRRMTAPTSKVNRALKDDTEIQAYGQFPQYKAIMDDEFALSPVTRRRSTDYTVTVTEKDLLYYLDDNYLRYKYLVSEIPFARRSFNSTFYVNGGVHKTQANKKQPGKQNENKNHVNLRKNFANLSSKKLAQQQNTQTNVSTNSTPNSNLTDQRDELKSELSNENKNASNNDDYSHEFFWDGNSNVTEKGQPTVNRRMFYKRPPNDEIENSHRYRKKRLKKYNSASHKNKALRKAVLRNKANFRRNKMYSEHYKVVRDNQRYIQQLKKYRQLRNKNNKHMSQLSPYQLKTKMRQSNNILHNRQVQSSAQDGLQERRRRYQKDYRLHFESDRIQDSSDDDEDNTSQTNSPNNIEPTSEKKEDKPNVGELNESITAEDEYKEGQMVNQIQNNEKDDDETDGSWKQPEKKRYASNSLEHDIRTGKLIVGQRRMDTPLNDSQLELQDVKYEDGLNETQYEDIGNGDEKPLKDDLSSTLSKDNTTSTTSTTNTPTAKYKLIKVRSGGSRRSHKSERQFLQERRADGGVALIALDGGPFPQFRLPLSRRQYMLESRHKHDPLKDQLPKAARLSHIHLN